MLRLAWILVTVAASVAADPLDKGPRCEATRATCFGLAVHVADGASATATWLAQQVAGANQQFAPLSVGFQIESIDGVPAAFARVRDRSQRDALGEKIGGDVVHVFVTGRLDDIDIPGGVIRGVTWRHDGRKFVILSTVAFPRVLAHELGHVFGLPHSTYTISIMNKTERSDPPPDQRRFADPELAIMRKRVAELVREKLLANLAASKS
jgi:matrixin